MALPALTTQEIRTSQLQMTPIFSLITSTNELKPNNARIPTPLRARVLAWLRPRPRQRAPSHNAACETTLALGTVPTNREVRQVAPPAGSTSRCLIPGFDGALFSREWKDALWARFSTAAPQRQRRSVERYSIVKRA